MNFLSLHHVLGRVALRRRTRLGRLILPPCGEALHKRSHGLGLLHQHLLADVQDVCDRIVILFRGKQLRLGYVSELLEDRDILQLQVRGASEQLRKTLEKAIETDKQAELVGVSHPTSTLEELFLRIIRESEAHPGRRVQAAAPPGPSAAASQGAKVN